MKEINKAIIGAIGLISVLAFGIGIRKCGPKLNSEVVKPVVKVPTTKTYSIITTVKPNTTGVDTTTVTTITKEVALPKPKYKLDLGVTAVELTKGFITPVYDLGLQRRLGDLPASAGVRVYTDGKVGLTFSVEF